MFEEYQVCKHHNQHVPQTASYKFLNAYSAMEKLEEAVARASEGPMFSHGAGSTVEIMGGVASFLISGDPSSPDIFQGKTAKIRKAFEDFVQAITDNTTLEKDCGDIGGRWRILHVRWCKGAAHYVRCSL